MNLIKPYLSVQAAEEKRKKVQITSVRNEKGTVIRCYRP